MMTYITNAASDFLALKKVLLMTRAMYMRDVNHFSYKPSPVVMGFSM